MNIEIANRLVKLRKEKGLSQEQLAEELGISRQAVSKWERAESSPDTDNLICLAKLYNMSLDDLLMTEDDLETIKEEQVKNNNESFFNINSKGIHIKDENDEVKISVTGIKIKDNNRFGDFYITAEAKLNPDDKFDKTIGRKVAETKAEMKIRKLEQYIISELTEMAHRLYDCAQNADEVCSAKMMTTSMSLDTIIN